MKICLVVVYFGKMPNYFNLWLKSCKYNETIDFLIFTDNQEAFNYPQNVKVIYTTFEKIKEKVQSCFDFKISLEKPYKLCDYKPIYGQVFKEYLEKYDYWGHCDIDTIFGDLRKFLKEDILLKNDKILKHGHFSLYKNEKRINENYKELLSPKENKPVYKTVFRNKESYCFDETAGIFKLYDNVKYKIYQNTKIIADISIKYNNLVPMSWKKGKWIFEFYINDKQSKLYGYYIENNKIKKEEFMYIHLQKRKMKMENNISKNDNFFIIPDKFVKIDEEITKEEFKKLNYKFTVYRKEFILYRIKEILKNLVRKIKEKFKI